MYKLSIAAACLLFTGHSAAAVNFSIEKDFVEIGLTAPLTDESYLFIGADSDDWIGIGVGYQYQTAAHWRLNAYYEYGLYDDWFIEEVTSIDGIKTSSHMIDLSASLFWQKYSFKSGVTAERIRNGFTWITIDDTNKYSVYTGAVRYFEHIYLAARYEHHYATDESDMLDFNQGHANEWEVSIGTMKPIWHFYPYAKVGLFSPNGTYFGMESSQVTWTIGGAFSF
ncbi:hypothetical protein DZ860_04170 [Vibrio sinensis]|uniref:Porin family protein n=1 Tax=Vibrio sinensis TaxID=2302434 RepID=A0A3A6R0L4_9VIBR|nr:hypothetical protein [Vibrio sinensis]RJX74329.1 hypothetical protein DZ860_04170 [Vibrio sinensis]